MDESKMIGCLCWFWHDIEVNKEIGILADIYNDDEYPEMKTYYALNGFSYKHCEPVKKEHVKFYGDK